MRFIIEIDTGSWVAGWEQGDPPRTSKIEYAQQFNSRKEANERIIEVKKTHPLKTHNYTITPI